MLILLTTLLACKHYDTVDEACADDVPGEKSLDDSPAAAWSLDFTLRQNCYRRYVGLSQVPVHYGVQYAVDQHGEYLALADLSDPGIEWGTEVAGPQYYAPDALGRLAAGGYAYESGSSGLWEVMWTGAGPDVTGAELVDEMMLAPDWHEILLQFEPLAAGWSHGVDALGLSFVYGNLVYDFPSSEFKTWVTYPQDGQKDVPRASDSGFGTPLSIVVGSTTATGDYNGENPYALELVRVPQLVAVAPVATAWTLPGTNELVPLRYSAIGEPLKPLDAETEYTLEGEFRWEGGQKDFQVTFTTAADLDTTETTAISRETARGVRKHHPPGETAR